MERDEVYTPDYSAESETKTLKVEDWEEKAEDISAWLEETKHVERWKVYAGALGLIMIPQEFFGLAFLYAIYKAYQQGFLFSSKYIKEAQVEK